MTKPELKPEPKPIDKATAEHELERLRRLQIWADSTRPFVDRGHRVQPKPTLEQYDKWR